MPDVRPFGATSLTSPLKIASSEFYFDFIPLTLFKVSEIHIHLYSIPRFPLESYFKDTASYLFHDCLICCMCWLSCSPVLYCLALCLGKLTFGLNCGALLAFAFCWVWWMDSTDRSIVVGDSRGQGVHLCCHTASAARFGPFSLLSVVRYLQGNPSSMVSALSELQSIFASQFSLGTSGL